MIKSIFPVVAPALPSVMNMPRAFGVLSSSQWLDAVYTTHQKALAALSEHQKHFLLPKPRAYFEALLNGEGGAIIGAINTKGKLAGFCAVVRKANWQEARDTRAVTCLDENQNVAAQCGDDEIVVVQSFCVKPTSQGRAFSQGILESAFLWAQQQVCASGKCQVVAQVSTDNQCGWTKFMRARCAMESTWTEDVGGTYRSKFLLRHMSQAELIGAIGKATDWVDGASFNEKGPNALAEKLMDCVEQGNRVVLISPPSRQTSPFYAVVPVNG